MEDKKVRMPSGAGGIMQYYEDYHSKISISPWHVIILTVIVMVLVISLHIAGPGIFGI
jgi:preprotein translocase subunit Sec61beta